MHHHDSESITVSLDRPRTIILYTLYTVACFAVSFTLAGLALIVLSRFG